MDQFQQLAVTSNAKRLQVIGPPGTGKTRVLANRIARLIADGTEPGGIVALTFTNSSCISLRKNIAHVLSEPEVAERVRIQTFHSFCQDLVKQHPEVVGLESHWEMIDFLDMQNMLYYPFPGIDRRKRFRNNYANPELREHTQKVMQRLRTYDFNQALEYGQRISKVCDPHISHLVVDEFQDCSAGQWQLVRALLAASPSSHFVAAGDPNQDIFNFQENHQKSVMTAMATEFPGTETVQLKYNYRSSKQILDLFQHVLPSKEALIPTLPEGVEPRLSIHENVHEELSEVVHVVRSLCCVENSQYKFDDIAILVRLNSQAQRVREFLQQNDIPAKQEQSVRALSSHKMASVALTLMKWCQTPKDFYLAQLLYNRFYKFVSDKDFQTLMQKMSTSSKSLSDLLLDMRPEKYNHNFLTGFLPSFRQKIFGSATPEEVSAHVKAALNDWREAAGASRATPSVDDFHWKSFVALMDQGHRDISSNDYTEDEGSALKALLRYCFARDNPTALAQKDGKVSVSTIHSAKSNEWPVVLLPSMHWPGQIRAEPFPKEERRLQYVAASRAQERLYFMNVGALRPGSRNSYLPVQSSLETMSLSDAKAKYPLVFQTIPLTRRLYRVVKLL